MKAHKDKYSIIGLLLVVPLLPLAESDPRKCVAKL